MGAGGHWATLLVNRLETWEELLQALLAAGVAPGELDTLNERRQELSDEIARAVSGVCRDWLPGDSRRQELKVECLERWQRIHVLEEQVEGLYRTQLDSLRSRLGEVGRFRAALGGYGRPRQRDPRRIDTFR